jgi:hypothetical protein
MFLWDSHIIWKLWLFPLIAELQAFIIATCIQVITADSIFTSQDDELLPTNDASRLNLFQTHKRRESALLTHLGLARYFYCHNSAIKLVSVSSEEFAIRNEAIMAKRRTGMCRTHVESILTRQNAWKHPMARFMLQRSRKIPDLLTSRRLHTLYKWMFKSWFVRNWREAIHERLNIRENNFPPLIVNSAMSQPIWIALCASQFQKST